MAGKEIAVKKYVVKLSAEERARLEALIHAGKSPAQLLTRARILLKADTSEMGEGWSDSAISAARRAPAIMARRGPFDDRGQRRAANLRAPRQRRDLSRDTDANGQRERRRDADDRRFGPTGSQAEGQEAFEVCAIEIQRDAGLRGDATTCAAPSSFTSIRPSASVCVSESADDAGYADS